MTETNTPHLERQEILEHFDNYWEAFSNSLEKRIAYARDGMEKTAYRQLVKSLEYDLAMQKHIAESYERVFSALGVNPREHPAWCKR